ncbi:hypothetical protein JHK87_000463 [Glycine soja]|nr:hypothetical protein JHK87_000463 [Glycine soja]
MFGNWGWFGGEKGKFDELLEDKGVKILIDPKALMNVIGTKMDFVDDKLSSSSDLSASFFNKAISLTSSLLSTVLLYN